MIKDILIEKGKLETHYKFYMSMVVYSILLLGLFIYTITQKITNKEKSWYQILNQRITSGHFLPFTSLQSILFISILILIQCIFYIIVLKNNHVAYLQGIL